MSDSTAAQGPAGGGAAASGGGIIEPSVGNALPYLAPVAIFPFMIAAAMYGGWWLAGPFAFFLLTDSADAMSGLEERNMEPAQSRNSRLFWYKSAVWAWVALYPVTLLFTFWRIFGSGQLAIWENVLLVLALGSMARLTLNAGHDMMHRRSVWERRIGEFLMASVSFPQEVTEHVYVHHAHIGTPRDSVSAPKGQSFWQYLPRSVFGSYLDAWRFERDRLARRRLPVWHYTNPVWRYAAETVAWYALAYWLGGAWGIAAFAAICAMGIFQLRMVDYVQHYGLQRIRLPSGRFEPVRTHHSWSSAFRLSNWLYYNAQRHADHHIAASRLYPLLQHSGEDKAPQMPGSYSDMGTLIMFPRRWFRTMDPLVDRWRKHFYPQIEDWSAYDSPAYQARPDAFEAIAEIHAADPRLATWINRDPGLLDNLKSREFADLDLPDGFGPDPEYEAIARRGLARVYWTRELGVPEMREQIAEFPVRGAREAVEAVRHWSNGKVFQIGVHAMRGNLTPAEAGTALSNVAEASVAAVLAAVEDYFPGLPAEGGAAAAVLGDLATGEATPGAALDVVFAFAGEPAEAYEKFCRGGFEALRVLSGDNLLFSPIPRDREPRDIYRLDELPERHPAAAPAGELPDTARARCVFRCGDAALGERFEEALRDALARGAGREAAPAAGIAGSVGAPRAV